ncbi:MAG TPA: ABC transporter permease, partial [Candidatus Limnocylindrales bacterium]
MTAGRTLSNIRRVARREFIERTRSRAFVFSTLLLAGLAVVVALIPLGVRLADRANVSRVGVTSTEPGLAAQAIGTMDSFLNAQAGSTTGGSKTFDFVLIPDNATAERGVGEGVLVAALSIERGADGGLAFTVLNQGALAADRSQLLQVGAFAVGILDWTRSNPGTTRPFVTPTFNVVDSGTTAGPGGQPAFDAADFASRRIVGIVFVVLSFLTLVFYGLWVASGVVAEKSSRVMELLISAATAKQLVVGKILGIGLAGLAQVTLVLLPAVVALLASGSIGDAVLGPDSGAGASLSALSPGLLAAFLVYFVLGFGLYAALYAGAGSLLSREEDLQTVALPLSIPAVAGYFPAVLALSGSSTLFIRLASYVPLWSPFVMMSRLAVGHVEPWELVLSVGLLVLTVPLVTALAIRVYRAGVVTYGQPPSPRTYWRAVR